jgi:fatty-acyl-CoA synthase
MMDTPLNAWLLFDHAPTHLADVEVVTGFDNGAVHRYRYGDMAARAMQLMHALDGLGLAADATIATLAWNSYRHLEAYFAVPCTGRVLHTLNLRLSPDELGYIIDHARDDAIIVDTDLVSMLVKVREAGGLTSVRHVIVMGDDVPDVDLPGLTSYEQLIATHPTTYPRKDIDENAPFGICYTSGTTGRSKGVVYTHRSTVLHSYGAATGAGFSLGPSDCVLPVVPMFHANAWGIPYAATMVGAKQVFLCGSIDSTRLVDLLASERVTVTAGVPTIWLEVGDVLSHTGTRLPDLRHIGSGGAQPPRALIKRFREEFGIPILQLWGMTETSPLASAAWPKHHMRDYDTEQFLDEAGCQAGLPLPGVDLAIRSDDSTEELPWNGTSMGRLVTRGPWVVDSYRGGEAPQQFEEGWFCTGDVAVGTPGGYFRIADRTKDLIKSGGEWISSVDMEAALMAMPDVAEAAVVAVPDAKWQERPLACVVPRDGAAVELDDVHAHLMTAGFARWQLPDRIELIAAIPRTSVGKFDKKVLRAQFANDAEQGGR